MPELPTFEELCDTADDQLFNKTVSNCNHVLHSLLPPSSTTASQHYNLRRRMHTLSLPFAHTGWAKKWHSFYIRQQLHQILTDFKNFSLSKSEENL